MGNGGSQQDQLTDAEADALQAISTISSSLSILGSFAVIAIFFWRRDRDFMNEMVVWVSVLDLCASFWFLLGPIPQDNPDFCITQGFFIQVSGGDQTNMRSILIFVALFKSGVFPGHGHLQCLQRNQPVPPLPPPVPVCLPLLPPSFCLFQPLSPLAWKRRDGFPNHCLPSPLRRYSFVCGKKSLDKLKKRRSIYLGVSFGIPLISAFLLPLVEDASFETVYQPTLLWCWIPKYLIGWQMGIFYVFVAAAIAINIVVFGLVSAELLDKSITEEAAEASSHIVSKLNKYIAVFVFLYVRSPT
jgi:hypothetical protein